VHASLAASSSSKMSIISSALLAAAASEEAESADSILERHMSLVFTSSSDDAGPNTNNISAAPLTCHSTKRPAPLHRRGLSRLDNIDPTAHHAR